MSFELKKNENHGKAKESQQPLKREKSKSGEKLEVENCHQTETVYVSVHFDKTFIKTVVPA